MCCHTLLDHIIYVDVRNYSACDWQKPERLSTLVSSPVYDLYSPPIIHP